MPNLDWHDLDATIRLLMTDSKSVSNAMACCTPWLDDDQRRALSALDLRSDADRLAGWLDRLLTAEPPDSSTIALMFGIAELVDPETEAPFTDLYLSGSDCFDPDDEDCDWAVQPVYFPEGRYAGSGAVRALAQIGAAGPALTGELLTAAYAAAAVREACERLGPAGLLRSGDGEPCDARAVAVGHDSGGAWVLGVVVPQGLITVEEFYGAE